jgi:hypothetical protein
MAVQINSDLDGISPGADGVNYTPLSANGTTTIKTGPGQFFGFQVINAGTTWTITVYDNTAASGNLLSPNAQTISSANNYLSGIPAALGINFSTGLTIVLAGTTPGTINILWQ